jgi:hypothetical protein
VNTEHNTVLPLIEGEDRKPFPRRDIKMVGINLLMMIMTIIIIIIIIRRAWRSEEM